MHLADTKPILAYFLTNTPAQMLEIFDEVALGVILIWYPAYERIHSEVHVRISDFPVNASLRDLRRTDLNNLVRVTGVVTRRTGVFPQLKYVKFDCQKCGSVLGPFYQDHTNEVKISFCPNCEKRGPFTVNSEQVILISISSAGGTHLDIDRVQELPAIDPTGIPGISSTRSPS